MNWRHIKLVFRKEMLDTLRDKRTLLGLVILPVLLMPILILGMPALMQSRMDKAGEELTVLAVVGAERGPELVSWLEATGSFTIKDSEQAEQDLADGHVDAVLIIPENWHTALQLEETTVLQVQYDAAREKSGLAAGKLQSALDLFATSIIKERLAARGFDTNFLTPFHRQLENIAPEEKMGSTILSFMLPMIIGIWAALGGMYTAIDVAAGEKERGTLEPLLATPPKRSSLVMGKYLAVVVTSMFSATLSLASLILSMAVAPQALASMGASSDIVFVLPPATLAAFLLASLLLAGLFSAISIVLSVFARSFKEAQVYLSPLSFLLVIPAFLTQFITPAEAPFVLHLLPIANNLLMMKGALLGGLTTPVLLVSVGSSLLYIAIGIVLTIQLFSKEQVLFRT
ncbi:MAG: ABC transporter permease [Firmicutes bacterium]|nr:ABC transporter permease [Bacillota bacterium]